jgi:pilus assembly protein Flp/PilA
MIHYVRYQARAYARQFIKNEAGVTAVEYSVLAVLIIAAIVAAMTTFRTGLTTAFSTISTKLSAPT